MVLGLKWVLQAWKSYVLPADLFSQLLILCFRECREREKEGRDIAVL